MNGRNLSLYVKTGKNELPKITQNEPELTPATHISRSAPKLDVRHSTQPQKPITLADNVLSGGHAECVRYAFGSTFVVGRKAHTDVAVIQDRII